MGCTWMHSSCRRDCKAATDPDMLVTMLLLGSPARQVKVDGSPAERVDKHPFCMSRVFYDATEKPEEVSDSA